MTNDTNIEWSDIRLTRNIMLTQSDWTQIQDSGLTKACVIAWRKWRREVRKINRKRYSNRLSAVSELSKLKENMPKEEYSDSEAVYFEQDGSVISRIDIKAQILEVLAETTTQTPPQTHSEAPEEVLMKNAGDIKSAKKHAQNEAENIYKDQIRSKSGAAELSALYAERLNEAIDCLSGTGTSYPLLEVLGEAVNKDIKEVATSVLKTNSNIIQHFVCVERNCIQALKDIKAANTTDQLLDILGKLRGYRY
jgi:uncharacterized Zn finger protein